jgi:hypothetical protein
MSSLSDNTAGDVADYSLLDQPGVANSMFYPRAADYPPSDGDVEYLVDVAPGVQVAARFFAGDAAWSSILFFHGNGEVASDYDEIAPLYRERRLNLVVAEFRGYGGSTGNPTLAALMADAHPVAEAFHTQLDQRGFAPKRYIMGRSLGAHPALELAANRSEGFHGLIIESGAGMIRRMLDRRGLLDTQPGRRLADAHDHLAGTQRTFEMIPGVGHNDLMWRAQRQYFDAIEAFTSGSGGRSATGREK